MARKNPDERRAQAVTLYVEGSTAAKVGEILGVAGTTVLRWVTEARFQPRSAGGYHSIPLKHDVHIQTSLTHAQKAKLDAYCRHLSITISKVLRDWVDSLPGVDT